MSRKKVYHKILYECGECCKAFSKKCHLSLHIRSHTGEKPHTCSMCKRAFSQRGDLTRHMRLHTGERPYKCQHCPRAFSHKSNLRQHIRLHTGERPFKCGVCAKSFSRKSILTQHQRLHDNLKPYECHQCKRNFSRKGALIHHMREHTGDWPFKCDKCEKGFSDRSHLQCHLRIHSGEKPFHCTNCTKAFGDKSNLNRHMKIHSHPNDDSCFQNEVNKTIPLDKEAQVLMNLYTSQNENSGTETWSLPHQISTHESRPQYTCEHCKKVFSLKSNLTKHIRTHTGEKPYSCSYCERSFSHKSNLTRHTKQHSPWQRYNCKICGIVFYNKGSLAQHNDIIHGIKSKNALISLPHSNMTVENENVPDLVDISVDSMTSSNYSKIQSQCPSNQHSDELTAREPLHPFAFCENKPHFEAKESCEVSLMSTKRNIMPFHQALKRSIPSVSKFVNEYVCNAVHSKKSPWMLSNSGENILHISSENSSQPKNGNNSSCSFGVNIPNKNFHTKRISATTSSNYIIKIIDFILSHRAKRRNGVVATDGFSNDNSTLRENSDNVFCNESSQHNLNSSTDELPPEEYAPAPEQHKLLVKTPYNHYQEVKQSYYESDPFAEKNDACESNGIGISGTTECCACSKKTYCCKHNVNTQFQMDLRENSSELDLNKLINETHSFQTKQSDPLSKRKSDYLIHQNKIPENYQSLYGFMSESKSYITQGTSYSAIQYILRWIAHARQKLIETHNGLLEKEPEQSQSFLSERSFMNESCEVVQNSQSKSVHKEKVREESEVQCSGWMRFGGYMKPEKDISVKSELEVSREFIDDVCYS